MEGTTFLTRVVVENYKSIPHCDVRLGPLTFLVGPNGAGKSNFLDALHFVADALRHSVGQALRNRGGGNVICHAPHMKQGYFRIHLEFSTPTSEIGHYTLKVSRPDGLSSSGPWGVQEELIGLPTRLGDLGPGFKGQHSSHAEFRDRLALARLADEPAYKLIYTDLTRILFYNINPKSIEDVVTFEPGYFLPLAVSRLRKPAGIFVLLDADDDDPETLGPELLRRVEPSTLSRSARSVPLPRVGKRIGGKKRYDLKLPARGPGMV